MIPGGPGSGKVTHCDTLTQEKKGIVHINMTDLLQQYALGNGESRVIQLKFNVIAYLSRTDLSFIYSVVARLSILRGASHATTPVIILT